MERRRFIKRASAVGFGSVSGFGIIGKKAQANQDEYEEVDYQDKALLNTIGLYPSEPEEGESVSKKGIASSLYLFDTYENSQGERLLELGVSGSAITPVWSVSYDPSEPPGEDPLHHYESFANYYSKIDVHNGSLYPPEDPDELGTNVSTSPDKNINVGDAAFTVLKGAFSTIHPAATAVSIASDTATELVHDLANKSGPDNKKEFKWSYDGWLNTWEEDEPDYYTVYYKFYIEVEGTYQHAMFTIGHEIEPIRYRAEYSDPASIEERYAISQYSTIYSDEKERVPESELKDNPVLAEFAGDGDLYRRNDMKVEKA
jgi:hypothetical protein